MQTLTLYSLLAGFLLLFNACTDESDLNHVEPEEKYQVTAENYLFYADKEKFVESTNRRSEGDYCRMDFQIHRIQRTDNELAIHISRPKDCEVTYEIIWDGMLMESFPMMANIFVRVLGEECKKEDAQELEVLLVNLEKIFKNMSLKDIENTSINLLDACSSKDFICSNDCDVPVSN